MSKLIENDPLREADLILTEEFYGRGERREGRAPAKPAGRSAAADKPKPTHYKIVCISLYTEDIERLEALVAELKKRGHTKANKSAVIRYALDSVDIGKMPKGY
jgi:hypothetical protein